MAFVPLNRLKQCRYGPMLYNIHDMYVGRSYDLYGENNESEVELYRQILRPNDVVVDAGANIGAFTVFFAQAVGPGGIVLAFEPQRIVFQTLCANVALNDLTNVHCYQMGLASQVGSLKTAPVDYAATNNFGGLPLGNYSGGETIQVNQLDNFNVPSCRLLKIDVEGMEIDVLKGATRFIERYQPILCVENDRPQNSDALIRFIDSLGYRMHWHRPVGFNPNNFFKNPTNVFGRIASHNLLCVPEKMPFVVEGSEQIEVPKDVAEIPA